ncbi:hypothetical protein MTBBW1_2730009 [Desulfamplus magnetovallimortis]|uniref:Uncharacterized protein n=2 Tax=Desulfamplus magnetovallimortis TaxID=1246637 RepID=A0A1W1HF74_9BACT|nr:hypothetical protein MTBBW1_2730009 [Desulfamplus magnetovallimortis]
MLQKRDNRDDFQVNHRHSHDKELYPAMMLCVAILKQVLVDLKSKRHMASTKAWLEGVYPSAMPFSFVCMILSAYSGQEIRPEQFRHVIVNSNSHYFLEGVA